MMRILSEPREGASSLVVTQLEENLPVPLPFVLTLEHDPAVTFARGRISFFTGEGTYYIPRSRALFNLLHHWLNPNLTGGTGV